MVPSAPTGWLMAQAERDRKATWPGREREEEETGEWRETQTGRKTEQLIRICLFSLVRQQLRV